jgi:UPF0755 protein
LRRKVVIGLGAPLIIALFVGVVLLFFPSLADPPILWLIERVDVPVAREPAPTIFQVFPGENARDIGEHLEKDGLINNAFIFRMLVNYYDVGNHLKAGEYQLSPDMTATDIIIQIRRGLVRPTWITLIEGWRLEQMAQAIEQEGIFDSDDFLKAARGDELSREFDFLKGRPITATIEGYLFPDTYLVKPQLDATAFLEDMLNNLEDQLGEDYQDKLAQTGLSLHEALTLASIVEREAVLPEERPIIAGVFLKRLRVDLPLQADPTVQYALAQDEDQVEQYGYWKQNLTRQNLQVESPYNTYLYRGLPPGPICNPGLASIEAVLNPVDTNYLYFVSRGDGSHAFAETYEEHQRNIAKYRGEG